MYILSWVGATEIRIKFSENNNNFHFVQHNYLAYLFCTQPTFNLQQTKISQVSYS